MAILAKISTLGCNLRTKFSQISIFFLRGDPRLPRILADPEERIQTFVDTATNGPVQVGKN